MKEVMFMYDFILTYELEMKSYTPKTILGLNNRLIDFVIDYRRLNSCRGGTKKIIFIQTSSFLFDLSTFIFDFEYQY